MTDRVHSLTVVLDKDIRDDDIEGLANAIRHMVHVADVGLNVADSTSYMAEVRADQDWRRKILALFDEGKT